MSTSLPFRFFKSVTLFLCVAAAMPVAHGQQQTAPPGMSPVVEKPSYITVPLEIAVNKPAAEVWKRVGKYCDIGDWFRIPCKIVSGNDGEIGAIRSVADEILVGRSELSYTYTQPVKAGKP